LVDWAAAVWVMALPVAVGAAILRYRLYDLDRIISRTLAYGLLTVLLGGGYALVVLGLGRLLGRDSPLVVAAATLAVAAVFQPARRRVQRLVDRRFNRRRYDAAQTIRAFSARLREEVDLDTLTAELLAVVDQTMQPTQASLWLQPSLKVPRDHSGRAHPGRPETHRDRRAYSTGSPGFGAGVACRRSGRYARCCQPDAATSAGGSGSRETAPPADIGGATAGRSPAEVSRTAGSSTSAATPSYQEWRSWTLIPYRDASRPTTWKPIILDTAMSAANSAASRLLASISSASLIPIPRSSISST